MSEPREELRARFDAWMSGELPPEAEAAFLSAAAGDSDLAAEVAAVAEVVTRLRALPRSAAPETDLWPGIAQHVRSSERERLRVLHASRLRTRRLVAGLAAVILLALAATVAWRANRQPPVVEARHPLAVGGAPGVALAAYAETDQTLGAIRDDLRRAIEARQDKLPPETRALVFDNLRTIDRAIAEIEAALHSSPADHELARTYIAYRERQIDLLRQANRMAARL